MTHDPRAAGAAKFAGSRAVNVGILDSGIDPQRTSTSRRRARPAACRTSTAPRSRLRPESPIGSSGERVRRRRLPRHARRGHRRRAAQRHRRRRRRARRHARPGQGLRREAVLVERRDRRDHVRGRRKLNVINMSFYADDPNTTSGRSPTATRTTARRSPRSTARSPTRAAAASRRSPRSATRRGPRAARLRELPRRAGRVARRDRRLRARPDERDRELLELRRGAADVAAPGGDGPTTGTLEPAILSTVPGRVGVASTARRWPRRTRRASRR